MTSALTLRKIYMFTHLSDERLAEVEAVLKPRELKAGEVLFNMDDPGDELYIVESGQIAIYAPDATSPGNEKAIRIFDQNDALGEMALIDRKPRSLSARALKPSLIKALGLADFQRFVQEDPAFSMSLMEGLSDRIRYTTDFLAEVKTWVGRVSSGEYNDPAFVGQVRKWMQNIADGNYEQHHMGDGESSNHYTDETLSALAAEFATMTAKVQQREEELKQQISELKIAIDNSRREEEVKRVTQTKNFEDLRARAKAMREEAQRFDEN
jgi:CRP-like cAMP-binding protein